ncbi:hypothetical protein SISSUDRAFT_1129470 [Sistotremastrum suecicum HHB10207 ss-3]|uniref:Membrane anchor Opy2 N-terminal domain-containing protein n=1 Tax=Sistotremastrum suecicum HHB10207 ss-3 TaxID=1314776 RepID=A0A166CP39_9AGAM|nr:hypothetical protein SISSUDRAFT_1129470 [Sistotremastrum suecicum HHB10207 ss-3]
MLLDARGCVTCENPAPCNCSPSQTCVQTSRNCQVCAINTCVAKSASSSHGISNGALAGGIVGAIIFLGLVSAFLWYLHVRSRRRHAAEAQPEVKPDIPAPAETVLSRPDPIEKPRPQSGTVRMYSSNSHTTINLDPESSLSDEPAAANPSRTLASSGVEPHNPFMDQQSIQTTNTQSTNVIPIALVPSGTLTSPASPGHSSHSHSPLPSPPPRPVRSPDLNLRMDDRRSPVGDRGILNLEHVNVSEDSFKLQPPRLRGAASTRSNMTGMSANSSVSYMTNASDLLNGEAPMIMTPERGAFRQVLGTTKPQFVEVPASSSADGFSPLPSSHLSPMPSSRFSRVALNRSPLAQSAFTPTDIEMDVQAERSPFDDSHQMANGSRRGSQATSTPDDISLRSTTTYGGRAGDWASPHSDNRSRDSIGTISASIGNARRVNVGAGSNATRTASGLLTPTSVESAGPAPKLHKRGMSYASEASSRADSILEAFPFVPPSPISSIPPRSPLSQQSFRSGNSGTPTAARFKTSPPSSFRSEEQQPRQLTDRRAQAVSGFSQASTMSSGLEQFPFQLDINSARESQPPLPQRDTRASLDTLALSRDLSAFPLALNGEGEVRDSFSTQR